MNKEQLDETFGGIVNDKFDTVVGKMVEKDGKYVFEGVSLNKRGQVIGSITYAAGIFTIAYVAGKLGYTITEKIANKIHQRKLMKAKAQAFDYMQEYLEEQGKKLDQEEQSKGKHFKDEESE